MLRLPTLASAAILATLCTPVDAAAQEAVDGTDFPGFAPRSTTRRFVEADGGRWQVTWNEARGVPSLIFGSSRDAGMDGLTDAHFERAARATIDELAPALGFDADTLVLDRVKHMNLARIGSSDKVVVKLRQVVDGVATLDGYVNVLFSADGKLLAVDNKALPHAAQTALAPTVGFDLAARLAADQFARDTGRAAASIEPGDYVLHGALIDARKQAVRAVPAYQFAVHAATTRAAGELEIARQYVIAARGAPRVLDSWSLVHQVDLTGTTEGFAQVGLLPATLEPHVLTTIPDVRLSTAGEADVFSAQDGSFVFPGVNSTQTVTATLDGQYSSIINSGGSSVSIDVSVSPGSPETITFNSGLAEFETAEVNVHRSVNLMRDWLKSIDPTETIVDFPLTSFVNIADTCNAQYAGSHMNYFAAGDGCPNTGYSTVVYHEEGHWLNALYGSGNSSLGFGEGGADVWAMYFADDPVIGDGFHGVGTIIRTGLNTEPFCGDSNLGCQGESHANGLPLMGALWKARQRLKDTLGDTAGSDVANLLLVSWHQAFNDNLINTSLRDRWLILDDDNGELGDGTPHLAQIDGGFTDQGFPAFEAPVFEITSLVNPDVVNHEGPVPVVTDIVEEFDTVATADVFYSTDGGQSFLSVPMVFDGGVQWSASIPGQASPAVVQYYVAATGPGGATNRLPAHAPDELFHYDVGDRVIVQSFDFEAGDDENWTHVELATQDDWQRGIPAGKSTDPDFTPSGTNAWGNDLGPDGFNGDYQPDVNNVLSSPVFDLTGRFGTRLRFSRWLGVEESEFDQAEVLVNGTQIWLNPFSGHVIDDSWIFQDFDISALADDNSSVQVEFELTSDAGLHFGGWNIDDLQVVTLQAVSDSDFTSYGVGTPGFGGMAPTLDGSGQAVLGGPVTLSVTDARPNAISALFIGTDQISVPGLGGTFLVGNILLIVDLVTNGAGELVLPAVVPDDALLSGFQITAQFWAADPDAVNGKAASNGLSFVIQ